MLYVGVVSMTVKAFAESLLAALAMQANRYIIDRRLWGHVVEPYPQRKGVWKLVDGDTVIELTRFDSLYGFMRLIKGSCHVEGVIEYRQWWFVFKPQTVDGDCSVSSAKPLGIEPYEEER